MFALWNKWRCTLFAVCSLVLAAYVSTAIAGTKVVIEVIDLHITGDTDGWLCGFSDPYIKVAVQVPEPGYGFGWSWVQTGVIEEQKPCTHPFVGTKLVIDHVEPRGLRIWVMDYDWPDGDDEMLFKNIAGIPRIRAGVITIRGASATIKILITLQPSRCGRDETSVWRDLPDVLKLGEPMAVTLHFHVDETRRVEEVILYEQIPAGFDFLGADVEPVEVSRLGEGELEGITLLKWMFRAPPGGEQTITYYIVASKSVDISEERLMSAPFGSDLIVDGVHYSTGIGFNEISFVIPEELGEGTPSPPTDREGNSSSTEDEKAGK